MAHFTYTAEKSDGEHYQGVAEAADRFELYDIVRREGGKIVTVAEDNGDTFFSVRYWNLKLARVKEYDKILFARNLGAMLAAGLSLARALTVMERQTKNIKLAETISEVGSAIRRGDPPHVALSRFPSVFNSLFVAMVKAGDEGGDLSSTLTTIADQLERSYDLKRKIRSAMIYPCIILVAIVGIGILMMIEVVPTLAQTFEQAGNQLPMSTQFIIAVSNVLSHYTVLSLGGIAGFVALVYFGVRTKQGARVSEFLFLHVPAIGELVRETNAARTARTLSSMLSSGVDVLTALAITEEVVQNSYFRAVIEEARQGVGAGQTLSSVFSKHERLYPAFVGEMMAVGEETGETVDMMKRLALYYEDQVDRKTKDMSTIIEPFLMLFIGAAVGFFAVSMIAPIYQMTANIH